MQIERRGFCLILSAPSGAGKSTLTRRLLEEDPAFAMSVSVTTRQPRAGELQGVDYHFLSQLEFEALRDKGELLEWALVFGNFYGTPAAPVETRLAKGLDILFDVDWQGANAIAKKMPGDACRVFVMPPSRDELKRRIYGRASEGADEIEKRLAAAGLEISHWLDYDYVIINNDIGASVAQLKAIATAERLKRHRQTGVQTFVERLSGDSAL
jgi:guanylate kinase